ncbi:two component transcriptional regulator, LytTR family [Alkaliphilus metalliredigens QYMF]|uniref:Stage 0 sporulation protein A homolog n=1 Tax=Alkaliphilus metalliredigens (strain QYMF) TaxID=293826 RepID=A6TU17_ALKMQ|nr:LytTR family DNA-binding domain-containing protein [Alkaliphilus metalliredigens]ABR49685.1 two component transcriptional regulator, LytTR family [Alkaliphilus metalliredigens QYMF]
MSTVLIVEDNLEQLCFLKDILEESQEDITIFTATSVKQAYHLALSHNINLFFIDIGLPDGSGLELAKNLRAIQKYELTWVVFLTTYTQYILKAFKQIHCYDYIVKPYKKEDIIAITKKLLNTSSLASSNNDEQYLTFQMKGYILKIFIKDIVYIEVYKKNCTIYTSNDSYLVKKMPLSKIYEMLSPGEFIQCHRSFLVNIHYIKEMKKTDNIWVITFLNHSETVMLGETFKDNVISKLGLSKWVNVK